MTTERGSTGWDKAAALAAAAAAILTAVMLAVAFIGDVFVDEGELREALRDTEDRITEAINDSTEQTNAQMEELRGYIVNHLDRHPAGADPAN